MAIPSNKCAQANAWLLENIGEEARDTFVPRLNATGKRSAPHSHAICNWAMSDATFDNITAELGKPKYKATFTEGCDALSTSKSEKATGRSFMAQHGLKERRRNEIGG